MRAEALLGWVSDAGIAAQLPIALLLAGLVISVLVAADRLRACGQAKREADRFQARFWSGVDLAALFEEAGRCRESLSGLEAVFEAGFREYGRLRQKPGVSPRLQREGAQRAMATAAQVEVARLNGLTPLLRRIAAAAPAVGAAGSLLVVAVALSGRAFELGGPAPIAAVAALTLAGGLLVAIPARWMADAVSERLDGERQRLEAFTIDLDTILARFVE